jgi:hypothetical protein
MKRIRWAELSEDQEIFVIAAASLFAISLTAGAIMTVIKGISGWDAPWCGVTAPIWGPLMAVAAAGIAHKVTSIFVDFSA